MLYALQKVSGVIIQAGFMLHVSAHSDDNSLFLYWPHVTVSILTLQWASSLYLGELIIWRTHFFLIVYCLQSDLEVLKYIAKTKIFLFQEECSKYGFSSGKIIFRSWQIWVDPYTISFPAEWDLQISASALTACFFEDSPLYCHLWLQALGENKCQSLKDILENRKKSKYPQNTGTDHLYTGKGQF